MPLLTAPTLVAGSLGHGPQPLVDADGLVLRPWKPADRDAVLAAYKDPAIQRWHVRSMDTPVEADTWLESWAHGWQQETAAGWAVTDRSSVVGRVALRWMDLHEGVGEVGYWVLPQARRQRVASRALSALTDWAFGIGFHRLELLHSIQNPASCHIADNASYALEGTKRQAALHADGWHDMHLHARVASNSYPTPESSLPHLQRPGA